MDHRQLSERECHDVLACTPAARLAVTRRGQPHIELVALIHLDGEPVALLPESSEIRHDLSAVVSPRRPVVLQCDDLTDLPRSALSVTVTARPRWVVSLPGIRACRRTAAAHGFALSPDTWFLALTRPQLTGHRIPLGHRTGAPEAGGDTAYPSGPFAAQARGHSGG
ncbi:hypothetical protein G5C60_15030 [Streptomyces sp. HC44]|uniref:Pyridoxamine 5'-phosphate oxidase n=1 Tax=Streptomyces scabichelini TaxID=2711217 RepID=A0A6G4V4U1_9ACTN|nr:hypothetical protein [Streptomyces scabichelini]NGO08880.1 hypothetical protein [Streptomyces scabichelini]